MDWIPLSEAALLIRRTWRTAWDLALAGKLTARRHGRAWEVERSSVERYLRERKRAERAESAEIEV